MLETIQKADNLMLDFIYHNMRFGILDIIMPFISVLGNFGFIWIVTAIVFICKRRFRIVGITVLVALLLCGLIGNLGLKPLFARSRPYDVIPEIVLLIPRPSDYSFPSGHTMSSFAAATVIFWHYKRFGFLALLFGVLMAISRLYLCVHYITDIFGGVIFGIGFGILSIFLIRAAHKRILNA